MKMRIRQIREQRGISQTELAERAGIRNATLSNIERGEGNPRLDTLLAIAAALNVVVTELFPANLARAEAEETANLLMDADPVTREAVLALIRQSVELKSKSS